MTYSDYRVLILDSDDDVRRYVRSKVMELHTGDFAIEIVDTEDPREALRLLTERFFDLVFVDLRGALSRDLDAPLLITAGAARCKAHFILFAGFGDLDTYDDVLERLAVDHRPRIVAILPKDRLETKLERAIEKELTHYGGSRLEVEGLDRAAGLIEYRRSRYPPSSLRESRDEVAVEVERICRAVFARVRWRGRRTKVRVSLGRLDRRGLSTAVLVRPAVRVIAEDQIDSHADSFDCVLKIGPVDEIREEVARYEEYVLYGVKQSQRVELLAFAEHQGMGGIVYSFAGGFFGGDDGLHTLDELMRLDLSLSAEVIEHLFRSIGWYKLQAGEAPIKGYFDRSYSNDLQSAIGINEKELNAISSQRHNVQLGESEDRGNAVLVVRGFAPMPLPRRADLARGWWLRPSPWCFVHGDMHGGNIMVEIESQEPGTGHSFRRACLIDYRNAGPGPRCLDAASLEASLRIADAMRIARGFGRSKTKDLTESEMVEAIEVAASRFEQELHLFDCLWHGGHAPMESEWESASLRIAGQLRATFDEAVTEQEYLQTALLYSIRQTRFPLEQLIRIRIAVWQAALYESAMKYHFRKGS